MCIIIVTINNAAVVSATPFHVDKSSVHLKNLKVPYDRRLNQNATTCSTQVKLSRKVKVRSRMSHRIANSVGILASLENKLITSIKQSIHLCKDDFHCSVSLIRQSSEQIEKKKNLESYHIMIFAILDSNVQSISYHDICNIRLERKAWESCASHKQKHFQLPHYSPRS